MVSRIPRSGKITLKSSAAEVSFYYDPLLKIFVISDCGNIGPHLVRVTLDSRGLYQTNYLLGGNEEEILPIARFLAPFVFELEERAVGQDVSRSLDPSLTQEILMSISIRKHDATVMRELRDLFKKTPSCLQLLDPVTLSHSP
jgi:hypothetical protein